MKIFLVLLYIAALVFNLFNGSIYALLMTFVVGGIFLYGALSDKNNNDVVTAGRSVSAYDLMKKSNDEQYSSIDHSFLIHNIHYHHTHDD